MSLIHLRTGSSPVPCTIDNFKQKPNEIMNKYNIDKLVKVTFIPVRVSEWHTYKKRKTLFGFELRKEGIYCTITDNYLCEKDDTVVDGRVMQDAKVILHFQSDHQKVISFKTDDLAKDYFNSLTNKINWI